MPYVWMGEYGGETFYVDEHDEVYNHWGDPEFGLSKNLLSNLRRYTE
jgi:hypothetical protein